MFFKKSKFFKKSNTTVDAILAQHQTTIEKLKTHAGDKNDEINNIEKEIAELQNRKKLADLERRRADVAATKLSEIVGIVGLPETA